MNFEFRYIRPDDADWFVDFPCAAIVDLCVDAYAGFIPISSAYLDGPGGLSKVTDTEFLRRVAHGYENEHVERFGDVRRLELQEAAQLLVDLVERSPGTTIVTVWNDDLKETVEETFAFKTGSADDVLSQVSYECLQFILLEARRAGESFSHALASGRIIGQSELLATLALIQCERCADAYLAGDIDSSLAFVADAHRALSSVGHSLRMEGVSLRARINGKIAHKGSRKEEAMKAVKAEYLRWQRGGGGYTNVADFARKMQPKYPDLTSEGSIKNACTRWREELKSLG